MEHQKKFKPDRWGQMRPVRDQSINLRQLNIDENNYVDFNSDEEEKFQEADDFCETQQLIRRMQARQIKIGLQNCREQRQNQIQ